MAIETLTSLVPPPAKPIQAEPEANWRKAEKALGIKLPADYLQLVLKYGSGQFLQKKVDATYIHNPLADTYVESIKSEIKTWQGYRESEGEEAFAYEVFPHPSGVYPIGGNDNGYNIFYLTEGKPDAWPVVVQGHDDSEFHRYDLPLTEFLAKLFSGEETMPPWPKKWFKKSRLEFQASEFKHDRPKPRNSIYSWYVKNGNKANFWVQSAAMSGGDGHMMYYHIKRVAGKSEGELTGSSPDYGNAIVVVDVFEDSHKIEQDFQIEAEYASSDIYYEVDPPSWWKGFE